MRILTRLQSSAFLRYNAVFFVGSIAAAALNYLYYPALGRLLDTASFGEVQALVSLFTQAAITLSVMGLVAINIVANYSSDRERNAVVLEFEKLALVVSIGIIILTLVFGSDLARFFKFKDAWPFMVLVLGLAASVPLTFRGAYLRGKKLFGLASGTNLLAAGGKLLVALLLVALGFGTVGAIWGIVIAQFGASGLALWWAARHGLRRPAGNYFVLPKFKLLKPELGYGLLVLVGSLLIVMQYSLDILIVKHYFDPHTAGLYAGIATVARIIFFLTASIAMVLMPMVRLDNAPEDNRKLLVKSMLLLLVVALPVLLLFIAMPERVVQLLMGQTYIGLAGLLPALSAAMFIISALNIIVSYHLALRRYGLAVAMVIGSLATYWLMFTHHQTLADVVNNLLIGSTVMLSVVVLWAGKAYMGRSVNLYERKVDINYSPGAQRSAEPKDATPGA